MASENDLQYSEEEEGEDIFPPATRPDESIADFNISECTPINKTD